MSGRPTVALVAFILLAAAPARAQERSDGALLHLVEPGVSADVSAEVLRRVMGGLDAPGRPRLQPAESLRAALLAGEQADSLIEQARFLLEASRARYKQGVRGDSVTRDLLEARALLLRALPEAPRVDLLREVWVVAGLLAHGRGDLPTAEEAFSRVLETNPSYRPDPRLFPPSARELMGRALMARGSTPPRALAATDAAAIGQRLGLGHLVVGHLRDTGLGDFVWRVDVLEVTARAYTGHAEVTFTDAPSERHAAADRIVSLIASEVTVGGPALAAASRPVPAASRPAPAPAVTPSEPRPESEAPASGPTWWVWAAAGALALGGAAAIAGASGGSAELEVRVHPPGR